MEFSVNFRLNFRVWLLGEKLIISTCHKTAKCKKIITKLYLNCRKTLVKANMVTKWF